MVSAVRDVAPGMPGSMGDLGRHIR